jgi:hypothetical protein
MAKIILFEDTNLSGKSVIFSKSGNTGSSFNDKISSLVVVSGTWYLFKDSDFSGTSWYLTSHGGPDGDGVYPSYKDWGGENDKVSSIALDNRGWMEATTEMHNKKLRNICLPASHDSGTFDLSDTWTEALSPEFASTMNMLNSISKSIKSIPGIGAFMPDPAGWLRDQVTPTVKGLAKATGRNIADQLRDGIRCFDFRVYYDENKKQYYIVHMLRGPLITELLDDFSTFIASNSSEIIYITFGHYQGFGESPEKEQRIVDFLNLVKDHFGRIAYPVELDAAGHINNDPFEKTYDEIINTPIGIYDHGGKGNKNRESVVIVATSNYSSGNYTKAIGEAGYQDRVFWPTTYSPPNFSKGADNPAFYGGYTNTSNKDQAMAGQQENEAQARARNLPFALYMTLTPQDDECAAIVASSAAAAIAWFAAPLTANPLTFPIGAALEGVAAGLAIYGMTLSWKTLKELSSQINKGLRNTVMQTFANPSGPNDISFIYTDFYEDTDLVDIAIELNKR